jgi:hypothetical protein
VTNKTRTSVRQRCAFTFLPYPPQTVAAFHVIFFQPARAPLELIALVRPVSTNRNSVLIDRVDNRGSKRARHAEITRHVYGSHIKYAIAEIELNRTMYQRSTFGAFTITMIHAIWQASTIRTMSKVRWHA